MPKTTKEIIYSYSDILLDDDIELNMLWYSQDEYDALKELYKLTKISHTEMCETVIQLRKYIKDKEFDRS